MKLYRLLAVGLILLVTSQALADDTTLSSGIDTEAMNRAVRPQDDFYKYVNGTWIDKTDMPADKSRLSMFSVLSDQTEEQLQKIIQDAAASDAPVGSNLRKLGDMYASFMGESALEARGYQPLQKQLTRIDMIRNHDSVAFGLGRLRHIGVNGPFGFYVYPDAKNPDIYGFWIYQGGLTMPDRDYYLKNDKEYRDYQAAFKAYAAGLLAAVDHPEPEAAAKRILALETAIAERHITRVEARDAEKNYNKKSAEELEELLGKFPWKKYNRGLRSSPDEVIVRNLPYFEKLGNLFSSTPVETWKDYLKFRTLDTYAPVLSSEFERLHFGFHQTVLHGVPENEERWKRAVKATSQTLGEVLGQEYVAKHFSPEAKERMQVLVDNLLTAYAKSIKELEWMSPETKEKALTKLSLFKPKIGYPDEWRDYSRLEIKADDLAGNLKRSAHFELAYDLRRIGKPVQEVDWGMTPQTVNAYYSPTRNEIVFPAAILQPPFFNMEADDAVNYGGIGAVIGHEIGHGFDDQGSKYDGHGNLRSWWTDTDRVSFDALGNKLAAQYDQFEPLEGVRVNGKLTLGENIGDLAGVTIGYRAYTESLHGETPPVIDGLTGPQRLFMGWAQVWRGKIRDDALRARLLSDPHSPMEYRVVGPLRNVDAFYEAFDVKVGDQMYLPPSERVKIW